MVNAISASYIVENPYHSIVETAKAYTSREIKKITVDEVFLFTEKLNIELKELINKFSYSCGIECMKYNIIKLYPLADSLNAIKAQKVAIEQKKADLLSSETKKTSNS